MDGDATERAASALERIGMVLGAMLATKIEAADLARKAHLLSRCGFSHAEIASILGSTANSVRVTLSQARKKSSSPKRKAKGR